MTTAVHCVCLVSLLMQVSPIGGAAWDKETQLVNALSHGRGLHWRTNKISTFPTSFNSRFMIFVIGKFYISNFIISLENDMVSSRWRLFDN